MRNNFSQGRAMNYFISFVDSLKTGKAAPVYLFCGEESFLQERALKKIREILLDPARSEFNEEIVDGDEVTAGDIVSLARTFPFMSTKRLLVVKNAKGSLSKGEPVLVEYFGNPAPFTCLVFVMEGKPDKRRKIYKELIKAGRLVDFKPLGRNDILQWLAHEARLAGKRLDIKAGNELLARVGTSLNVLENELGKILNYAGTKEKITVREVRSVVSSGLESNIFDMVDAMGEGDYPEALRRIKDLLLNKEPPQVIISLIARQFRLILAIAQPGGEKRLKLHPYVARKIKSQSKNFNHKTVRYALQELLEIDVAIKSGKQDFYPAIETMMMKIALLTV